MGLRIKRISLKKPLFLLATVSAFVLSVAVGYGADACRDPEDTVRTILRKQPNIDVTRSVQQLAGRFIQENRKLFISYCWLWDSQTRQSSPKVSMVDDLE